MLWSDELDHIENIEFTPVILLSVIKIIIKLILLLPVSTPFYPMLSKPNVSPDP